MKETTAQRRARLRRNLEEACRLNDAHLATWPAWMLEAARLSPVFRTAREEKSS